MIEFDLSTLPLSNDKVDKYHEGVLFLDQQGHASILSSLP